MGSKRVQLVDGLTATIRPLQKNDIDLLHSCFQNYSPEARKNFAPHPFSRAVAEDICEHVEVDQTSLRFLVTEGTPPDESALGYALLFELNKKIPSLGIGLIPRAIGRGLGRHVMEHLIATTRSLGYEKLRLTVMERNAPARSLYQTVGFHYYGARHWDDNGNGWSLKMEIAL